MKKLNKLIEKDAFYIILFLCICVAGISAVYLSNKSVNKLYTKNKEQNQYVVDVNPNLVATEVEYTEYEDDITLVENLRKTEENVAVTTKPVVTVNDEEKEENMQAVQASSNSAKLVDESTFEVLDQELEARLLEQEINELVSNDEQLSETSNEIVDLSTLSEEAMAVLDNIMWPVDGEIVTNYAVETLIYSETLDRFVTHDGIDIDAELGEVVLASADGKVATVIADSKLGITVEIDHGHGIITRYTNLSSNMYVQEGDAIASGTVIGEVGNTAVYESSEKPHLHFEIIINGSSINPNLVLLDN